MHQFLVTVDVAGWDDASERTAAQYAEAALAMASLPDARRLDGYADLDATADITGIEAA